MPRAFTHDEEISPEELALPSPPTDPPTDPPTEPSARSDENEDGVTARMTEQPEHDRVASGAPTIVPNVQER